ncbi:hypothetical protein OVY29_01125 [Sphingopyxis sp. SE2]|nr:hypothetical protein [Sphingopyxis sp. SE2]MDT7527268.1 hypothetical protein [Sphingopyxis sp. SE2]
MFGNNLGEQAPGKAIEVIDDNHLHRVLGAGREINHLVELLASKAAARDPGFFKNFEKLDPFLLGIGFNRRLLARNARVVLALFVDAHAHITKCFECNLRLHHFNFLQFHVFHHFLPLHSKSRRRRSAR